MQAITIRHATQHDIEPLLELYVELHEFHARSLPGWLRVPENYDHTESREILRGLIQRNDAAILVAESSGKLVALAEVYLKEDKPHPLVVAHKYGYLQSLAVSNHFRRQGLGTQLTKSAERWSQEHGAAQMQLSAWEFAEGPIPFYESLGYGTYKRWLMKAL